MNWVLLVFAHLSGHNALAVVEGFTSENQCERAGQRVAMVAKEVTRDFKFVCVSKH